MSDISARRGTTRSRVRTKAAVGRGMVAVAAAFGLGMSAVPLAAAVTPAVPTPGTPATMSTQGPAGPRSTAQPPTGADTKAARAVQEALRKAKATGKPVTVDALTTETSETVAGPDGHRLTTRSHTQTVRVKRSGRWQTLDATLAAGPGGTVAPKVTGTRLVLSGGGTGPLATVTTDDGKQFSVTAPFALPKPALSGATATYARVLPDVDLKVTALADGGWREVVVVKTAKAAADPRLKELRFPVRTNGLTLVADRAGNIALKDARGKVRMHAPTPFQWDSSHAAPTSRWVKAAAAANTPVATPTAPGVRSSAEQPGDGATVSTMKVAATADALVLTPDPKTFGKGTGPWYLDPTFGAEAKRQVNAQVQENHKTTSNVNTLSSLGVGYCGYSDCTGYGRYRSYFQLGIPSVLYGDGSRGTAQIARATLVANVVSSSAPGTNKGVALWNTPTIPGGATWNNQPCGTGYMNGCDKVGTQWITGNGNIYYDVKWWVQRAADQKWSNWTVGFSGEDENNMYYRHHLGADPSIVIEYDIAPTIWYPRAVPAPSFADSGNTSECQTPGGNPWDNPGWIGANQYVKLRVNTWSPTGWNQLYTKFHVWDDNDSTWGVNQDVGPTGSYGEVDYWADRLADGHQYGWNAEVSDGWLSSGGTAWCYFRIDKTPPVVSVRSTDFPASGTLNVRPKLKINETGTFTVDVTDPAPGAGLRASGPACVRWSTDPTPVTGWKCGDPGVIRGSGGSFAYTPRLWGTNILFVQAMDVAGNYSQPFPYTFYVPWDPATGKAVPGDLDQDGRGDILKPDAAGNLLHMTADTDPTLAQAALLGLAPQGTNWNDVQTSHRGALRSMGVDDVFAHTTANPALKGNLYLYPNKGDGTFHTYTTVDKPTTWAAPDGTPLDGPPASWVPDWSEATQILALGAPKATLNDFDGDLALDQTAVLAVERGNLWLYRSNSINTLDADAVLVSGTGNWGGFELINPGSASGTAQPTLWTRSLSDGAIRSYRIGTGPDGRLDLSGLADPLAPAPILTGITTADYPKVGSVGDATKDGRADLWAVAAGTETLKFWRGTAAQGAPAGAVTGFDAPVELGDTTAPVDRMRLATQVGGKTPDAYGKFSGTVKGGVSFTDDTVNGAPAKVATFNGTDGVIESDGLKVDPTKSFSISLWTKANALTDGVVISQDNTQASGFMVWPATMANGYVNWHLGMATADNGGWPYDTTDARSSAARVQVGAWTKLTISYNATTGQTALYVNDALAASGVHTTKLAAAGSLVLGRYKYQGRGSNFYNGAIADVVVHDYSVDPAGTTGPIASDQAAGSCLDLVGNVAEQGHAVQIYSCNGTGAQAWTGMPDGSLRIKGYCFDAPGNTSLGNGTPLQIWSCNGSANQKWYFRADGSIYNPASGRCVDAPGGNTLQLWDCNQTRPQRLMPVPVT
ncbi:ricin-type beta-trefoil lectin domain protein [Streptomyces sp. NBC_00250]|uniref:ricin-type beta-trefoil lectin domain protein n=1 Tax=Streptomyces sp. NBC_00250 TaxID=2903641 RepID=UPI002E2D77AB|nr:ricin-type beta-trefoil lectin domain protein [Streptomyces sp. NBC_00250]